MSLPLPQPQPASLGERLNIIESHLDDNIQIAGSILESIIGASQSIIGASPKGADKTLGLASHSLNSSHDNIYARVISLKDLLQQIRNQL